MKRLSIDVSAFLVSQFKDTARILANLVAILRPNFGSDSLRVLAVDFGVEFFGAEVYANAEAMRPRFPRRAAQTRQLLADRHGSVGYRRLLSPIGT